MLLADGRTRPIAELRVGDEVLDQLDAGRRRYVRTTVLAHWSTTKPAYRIRLTDGTELVASGEHRFLTARGWRHVTGGWCRSGRRPRLRSGDLLLGPGRFGPERPHTAEYRRGYLCGLVRGDEEPELGRSFPSDHLELEALGRAHHFLAELRHGARRPVRTPPVAVRMAPGRPSGAAAGRIAPPADGTSIADAVRWPARPSDDWRAGFLAGVIDGCGRGQRGELRIRHADDEVNRGGSPGPCIGSGSGSGSRSRAARGACGSWVARRSSCASCSWPTRRSRSGVTCRCAPLEGGAGPAVASVHPSARNCWSHITTGTGDFVAEGVVSHNCFARNTHTYLDLATPAPTSTARSS